MGVEGCTVCIKYMLFLFNFFFWLAGGVILGVALWLRHDNQISSILNLELDGNKAPDTFFTSVHILIAVGAVMMVVGFLGCYGAIQESQCLLGTFFACLVILFACEVAGGIWGYMNRESVSKDMISFYDMVYDKTVSSSEAERPVKSKVLKALHEALDCCGKGTVNSFLTQLTDKFAVTDICPNSGPAVGCHGRINELFSDKIYLIGIAALVVAVIMIFEMIFSMVLCCGIRNSPVY